MFVYVLFFYLTMFTEQKNKLISTACSEKSAYSVASAASNSSYGANVTATMSHDSISLTMSDDFPAELLQDFESASVYGKLSLF